MWVGVQDIGLYCTRVGFRQGSCKEMTSPAGGDQVIPGRPFGSGCYIFQSDANKLLSILLRRIDDGQTTIITPAQNTPTVLRIGSKLLKTAHKDLTQALGMPHFHQFQTLLSPSSHFPPHVHPHPFAQVVLSSWNTLPLPTGFPNCYYSFISQILHLSESELSAPSH